MKTHPNIFPLNKKHIHTQVWPGWIYLNYGRLCNICKAQSSPKIQWHAVGLGTEWLRKGLEILCEGKIIPQKCEIHAGTASQHKAQAKTTAPSKIGHVMVFPWGEISHHFWWSRWNRYPRQDEIPTLSANQDLCSISHGASKTRGAFSVPQSCSCPGWCIIHTGQFNATFAFGELCQQL